MGHGQSVRTRLIIAFSAIVAGVLALAAVFGIVRFDSMMNQQAQSVVATNMTVASGLLDDQVAAAVAAVSETAADGALPWTDAGARLALTNALSRRADLAGLTYFAVVSNDGRVYATSLGAPPYETQWGLLKTWAASGAPTGGFAVIPAEELDAIGLASRLRLAAKETPRGTIVEGEEDGALAIVSTTPVQGGVLVGVQVLKLQHGLVDSVVAKVGGTATLFQGGVRISTTVLNAEGRRALGTVVSDEVRRTTLDRGEPFTGEAFVVSKAYLTSYQPLRDSQGSILGMLFVGVDQAPYAAATRAFGLTFGAVILLALALALVGAFSISRSLAAPLTSMGVAAGTVATGDLTVRVPESGYREVRELGSAFNTMTGGLKTIIVQVDESVNQLRAVAAQITAASRSSAEQATYQASSVAETTATLEQLTRSFQAVADGARRVLDVAEDALESAQTGAARIDKAHGAMDELASGARDMAGAAGAMNDVAESITDVTSIITGIAEQTKILALNAAIEAARAGEAGKGFAVVSSEIRTLADSVGVSASQIAKMVAGIQDATGRLRTAATRQSELSDSTVRSSDETREAFEDIVKQMTDTAAAAREIAEATVQQTRASDQLVEAMHQVSVSSRETAVAAKQLTASAESVESEAEILARGFTRFRTR